MLECTQDMKNISLSPTMTSKLRNRDAANKIRNGSPKLQEVLRERCRQRMREKRVQLFNKRRLGLEIDSKGVQDTLANIIRKEFNDIATLDLDPDVNPFVNEPFNAEKALELESEIITEEEQWIIQEYERMVQEEDELLESMITQADDVICPICQKYNLIQQENKISCKFCNFVLNNSTSLKEIRYLIDKSVNTHNAQCKEPPSFWPMPENNNTVLYLICDKCSTWTQII